MQDDRRRLIRQLVLLWCREGAGPKISVESIATNYLGGPSPRNIMVADSAIRFLRKHGLPIFKDRFDHVIFKRHRDNPEETKRKYEEVVAVLAGYGITVEEFQQDVDDALRRRFEIEAAVRARRGRRKEIPIIA